MFIMDGLCISSDFVIKMESDCEKKWNKSKTIIKESSQKNKFKWQIIKKKQKAKREMWWKQIARIKSKCKEIVRMEKAASRMTQRTE